MRRQHGGALQLLCESRVRRRKVQPRRVRHAQGRRRQDVRRRDTIGPGGDVQLLPLVGHQVIIFSVNGPEDVDVDDADECAMRVS